MDRPPDAGPSAFACSPAPGRGRARHCVMHMAGIGLHSGPADVPRAWRWMPIARCGSSSAPATFISLGRGHAATLRTCAGTGVRGHCHRVRDRVGALGALAPGGQRTHAGNRRRSAGRRARLPQPAIPDHRHRRRGAVRAGRGVPELADGDRLRAGRGAVRRGRLHRHERLGTRQRAHRRGRAPRHQRGDGRGLPWRCDHRDAGGRAGTVRRGRVLGGADLPPGRGPRIGAARAGRAGVRRLADLDLRPPGRRHLHQGRRCRRRPGRQGRGRHSRGRPAQSGGDRRQRR